MFIPNIVFVAWIFHANRKKLRSIHTWIRLLISANVQIITLIRYNCNLLALYKRVYMSLQYNLFISCRILLLILTQPPFWIHTCIQTRWNQYRRSISGCQFNHRKSKCLQIHRRLYGKLSSSNISTLYYDAYTLD